MDLDKFFEEDSEERDFSFDFRRYLRGIFLRKWIVLGVFLVIIVPWLLYLKHQPPQYEAFTWIRFKKYDLEKLSLINRGRYIELTSRTFAENIVAQLGLTLRILDMGQEEYLLRQDVFSEFYTNLEPEPGTYQLSLKNPSFTLYTLDPDNEDLIEVSTGALSEITDNVYSVNGLSFQLNPSFIEKYDQIMFRVRRFRDAVAWFQGHVEVNMGGGGSLMMISMVYHNPIIVTEMVNSLAKIFVEESISFERKKALEYKNALEHRLKVAQDRLEKDQEELRRFKENHFISLDTDVKNNVAMLSSVVTNMRNLESHTERLKDLLDKLGEFGGKTITPGQSDKEIRYIYGQIAKNPMFENNTNMGLLAQQLTDFESERNNLVETMQLPPSNPQAVRLDEQILPIQTQIFDLAQEQLGEALLELSDHEATKRQIENEISKLPSEQMRLSDLTKNVEVSTNLYTNLRTKTQELEISEAVETEDVDILDPAIVPELPMDRDKKKNAVAGGILALFFSLGVAVVLEFLDKSIKSPDDIKKYLKLNVIGTIPKLEFNSGLDLKDADKLRQIDSQLVTYDYSPTPVGEAYRALRTKIVFSKHTGKVSSLVISSFAPGDGKSFTSSNLCVTLAQHKTNTLLVDADLRRGVLHNTFGVPKEPGLSNFLMGMARFEDIVYETHVPNLSLVSCGSMMPNPSELLGSIQLKRFIEEMRRRFDITIFDTPPLNAATDSVVLGTQVEGVVLIVRSDVTNRNVARQKLNLFDNVPAEIIGVVLNGTESDLAHEGYSYYHY
jgi:tyrosine-protein kinase Etk/Wzc